MAGAGGELGADGVADADGGPGADGVVARGEELGDGVGGVVPGDAASGGEVSPDPAVLSAATGAGRAVVAAEGPQAQGDDHGEQGHDHDDARGHRAAPVRGPVRLGGESPPAAVPASAPHHVPTSCLGARCWLATRLPGHSVARPLDCVVTRCRVPDTDSFHGVCRTLRTCARSRPVVWVKRRVLGQLPHVCGRGDDEDSVNSTGATAAIPAFPLRRARSAVPAWLALAATAAAAAAAAAVPGLRSPALAVAAVAAPVLLAAGVLRNRPRPALGWWLVALMTALWAVGTVALQVGHRFTPVVTSSVDAGQVVAVVVVLLLVRVLGRNRAVVRRSGSLVDPLVVGSVLALVAAQLVALAVRTDGSTASLVVPTVDVAICGLLLRVVLTHSGLHAATNLGLLGAVATVLYDLGARLDGQRLAVPGSPWQPLGIACVMLFAVAALHPSMTAVFDGRTTASRPPSAAFLGLLPLVVVPLALWGLARQADVPGLPTPAFLIAGSVVAGLCLLRGAAALRSSEYLAEHDALTDLLNRRGLARAFTTRPPAGGWSVLLVDVDEFKAVNDTHGHDTGDLLLREVRDRLLAAAPGCVVARNGGDEFIVLAAADRVAGVVATLLSEMREPADLAGTVVRVTGSVGVAPPDPGADLAELITRADIAMYVAKAGGRDLAVTFEPRMRVEVAHRFELTGQLRQLLGDGPRDVGRLELFYQPLVDLRTSTPIGAEALVRWSHPKHGLLQPGEFLRLVNVASLDTRLDAAVLRQAIGQLSAWLDEGREPLPVSVNLTRGTLLDRGFAEQLVVDLTLARVPARLVHLEITEHEELPDDETLADNLTLLQQAGLDLHLDDYGTGYTSLTYLSRFPIDVLKLDRSVVVTADGTSGLLAGVAAMAEALDLDVLAEGIETAEQHERLVELGIRYGQGYFFGRPMPAPQFAETVLGPARAARSATVSATAPVGGAVPALAAAMADRPAAPVRDPAVAVPLVLPGAVAGPLGAVLATVGDDAAGPPV